MSVPCRNHIVYRIYDSGDLIYVGKTSQPLDRRLHGHFFAKPMMRKIDPRDVTRIEYAVFASRADMNLYEIYYIEKQKPPLNFADKHTDKLTVALPDVDFVEHRCKLLGKWRAEIERKEQCEAARKKEVMDAEIQKRELRRQFHDGIVSKENYYAMKEKLESVIQQPSH